MHKKKGPDRVPELLLYNYEFCLKIMNFFDDGNNKVFDSAESRIHKSGRLG